jgi:hypothetical protein
MLDNMLSTFLCWLTNTLRACVGGAKHMSGLLSVFVVVVDLILVVVLIVVLVLKSGVGQLGVQVIIALRSVMGQRGMQVVFALRPVMGRRCRGISGGRHRQCADHLSALSVGGGE